MKGKQNYSKFLIPELFLSVVGAITGYIFSNSYQLGLCVADPKSQIYDVTCHQFYERIGDPLMYGMGALAIVFLFLLIVPQAFEKWKKFAVWFVPIAALFFVFYTDPKGMDMFSPYAEQVYRWIALTYIAISLAIIGTVKFKG